MGSTFSHSTYNACTEDLQDGHSENGDAGSTKSYDVTAEKKRSSHSLPFSTSLSNSEQHPQFQSDTYVRPALSQSYSPPAVPVLSSVAYAKLNATSTVPPQSQPSPTDEISPPPLRLRIDEPICSREIVRKRFFVDEWDHSNKRQKILVRALGSSGTQATTRYAFPYLPEIAYLSILCRLLAIMRMLKELAIYILAYLERLQGKCPTAVRPSPGAQRENLIWCRMRTQNLLNATRWWIASVCIFEAAVCSGRRKHGKAAIRRRIRLFQRFLDYGVLADEVLPKDLEEVSIGKEEEARKHTLVRSLECFKMGSEPCSMKRNSCRRVILRV